MGEENKLNKKGRRKLINRKRKYKQILIIIIIKIRKRKKNYQKKKID